MIMSTESQLTKPTILHVQVALGRGRILEIVETGRVEVLRGRDNANIHIHLLGQGQGQGQIQGEGTEGGDTILGHARHPENERKRGAEIDRLLYHRALGRTARHINRKKGARIKIQNGQRAKNGERKGNGIRRKEKKRSVMLFISYFPEIFISEPRNDGINTKEVFLIGENMV